MMNLGKWLGMSIIPILATVGLVGCDMPPVQAKPYRTIEQQNEDIVDDLLYNRRAQGLVLFSSVEAFNDFTKKYKYIHVSSIAICDSSKTSQSICAVIEVQKY